MDLRCFSTTSDLDEGLAMITNILRSRGKRVMLLAGMTALVVALATVGPSEAAARASADPSSSVPEATFYAVDLAPSALASGRPEARRLSTLATVGAEHTASGEELSRSAASAVAATGPDEGAQWFVGMEETPRRGAALELKGAGVINFTTGEYGPRARVVHSVRVVRQGHRLPGTEDGCTFEGFVQLRGESAAIEITDLAYDPARCLALVEVGQRVEPVATDAAASGMSHDEGTIPTLDFGSVEDGSAEADPPNETAVSSQFAGTPGYYAYTRSQVREPAYPLLKATSEVYAKTYVYYNNPCGSGTRNAWSRSWFEGWTPRDFAADASASNCTRSQMKVHAKFTNDNFCGPASRTNAHHWPTFVEGHRNYLSNHGTNTTFDGGCSGLLRGNQTIGLDRLY